MSTTKHIHNAPKDLVLDALTGLTYLNPSLTLLPATSTIALSAPSKSRVHLVSGGGSGHEPSHAGFVGEGMLSAAVCGQQAKLIEQRRTLLVVKNYTGDVLQFGLAKERWSATHPGADNVRIVVVGDDVAVGREQGAITGRRGLAGTVLVYKLAGALAAQGATLDAVGFLAKLVAERTGTIGVGLEHCHVPGTDKAEAYLGDDEVELGMGIHNESGVRKISPVPSTSKLVEEMLSTITATDDPDRNFLPFKNDGKDSVVLLVNNLGGLPELELLGIVKEASEWLSRKRITVERVLAGPYTTSLSLPGFSLSLLLLPRNPEDDNSKELDESLKPKFFNTKRSFDKELFLDCLDADTDATSWRWSPKQRPESHVEKEKESEKGEGKKGFKGGEETETGLKLKDPKLFSECLEKALQELVAAEKEITRFDTIAGDGDAGLTLKRGALAILDRISNLQISSTDVVAACNTISEVIDEDMGGTSGGLLSIFFSGLSKGFLKAKAELKAEEADKKVWARALELALNTLYQYSRARPPSRTLIDPLSAFILTFSSDPSSFLSAFNAAKESVDATKTMEAKAGRAAYVDQAKIKASDTPDAGAYGVLKVLEGVKEALLSSELPTLTVLKMKGFSDTPSLPPKPARSYGWKRYAILGLTAVALLVSKTEMDVSAISTASFDWVRDTLVPLPSAPYERAVALLKRHPLIDGHIDLPILARAFYLNLLPDIDLDKQTKGHVDVPRLREGGVGGFFWSAYVPCPEDAGYEKDNDGNFTTPTWRTRDTLEQIDVARLLIEKHSDTFDLVSSASEWKKSMKKGKIAGMIGVEGAHQLGSSLASIRTYFALGVRYITLSHTCHNALADSCGMQGVPIAPRWGGLSPFGRVAIEEMNRLGMVSREPLFRTPYSLSHSIPFLKIVDISHTHPATASQALSLSLAPPIFSHSNARGLHPVVRNVPDTILRRIGAINKSRAPYDPEEDGEGGKGWGSDTDEATKEIPSGDTIIMLNFAPQFISEWDDGTGLRANISLLADHADYIGKLAGREHVGIGSDYDGIGSTPEGLEDVSKYPGLVAELIARGWTDAEISGLVSGNILRILEKVEAVAHKQRHEAPKTVNFEGRDDLVKREW
ncbi:glycerone kinase [Pseudohyphozyma bogoriensis]|nr:glycerone kinase [Pseudohyphozyma bogoriensis]